MLKKITIWLDAKSFRDRLLLTLVAVVVIIAVSDMLFYSKQLASRKQFGEEVLSAGKKLFALKNAKQSLQERLDQDPDALEKERLQRFQTETARLDAALQEKTGALASPREMTTVLKEMMERQQGLELLGLQLLGAQPLLVEKNASANAELGKAHADDEVGLVSANIYRHGVEMRFRGDYFAVLNYLRKLEGSGWRFEWDSLDMKLEQYPATVVTLRISTLSMTEGWLGV